MAFLPQSSATSDQCLSPPHALSLGAGKTSKAPLALKRPDRPPANEERVVGFRLSLPYGKNIRPWEKCQPYRFSNERAGSSLFLPMRKVESERPGPPWARRLEPPRPVAPAPFSRRVRRDSAPLAGPTWPKPALSSTARASPGGTPCRGGQPWGGRAPCGPRGRLSEEPARRWATGEGTGGRDRPPGTGLRS